MKTKLSIFLILIIVSFSLVGCTKEKNKETKNNVNEVKTTLSCYKDFYLFHSKQHLENKIYLDKNNKLINYEYIESYSDFDSDNEFNSICEGSKDEAVNNTKIYAYLTQTSECNDNPRKVTIYNKYDLTKVTSKNNLEGKNMREFLDDEYILDIDNYKNAIIDKGYTCK